MRQIGTLLAVLGIGLFVLPMANAATTDELAATVQKLESRVVAQDKKIADLQTQLDKKTSDDARLDELKAAVQEIREAGGGGDVTLPKWLDNFKIFGDLRLRYHFECFDNGSSEKHIGRFRLRVGGKKTWLDKQVEVGFRFATGSSDDPTSTNQSFDDNFSEKNLWVDRAYAKYTPKRLPGFYIVGGKMANPFVHTNMMWDSDVNPEGVWASYTCPGDGPITPFMGFGFFQLVHNSSDGDATLHAYQVGGKWQIDKDVKWTAALAYYDYGYYEDNYSRAKNNTISGGRLTAEEFNVLNLTNKVDWMCALTGLPMSGYLDFAHNCGDEADDSDAIAIGIKMGKNKKKGDWSFAYKYAYIEANASPGAFPDSDFGATNSKGHQWGVKHNLDDFLTAGVNLFYTEVVSGADEDDRRVLVLADLIWKF